MVLQMASIGVCFRLPATPRPSIRFFIPALFSSAVAVSHFLFSSRLWRHGGLPGVGEVGRPPGRLAGVFFLCHHPSLPTPLVP